MNTAWVVELLTEGRWRPVGCSPDEGTAVQHAAIYPGEVRIREVAAVDLPAVLLEGDLP